MLRKWVRLVQVMLVEVEPSCRKALVVNTHALHVSATILNLGEAG
jgi:hypothetical protein